ncbi:hypothetical protein QCA50_019830 [Cerrena zonata]|uniref:Uncharacterized protein n=1 Tax=Cerrena zonata TaxID=2478898 RepID=A0AAW0FIQ6_9APHY
MAFSNHYEEVLDVIDAMFRGFQEQFRDQIEIVKRFFLHGDLVLPEQTVRLQYSEGIKMLHDLG